MALTDCSSVFDDFPMTSMADVIDMLTVFVFGEDKDGYNDENTSLYELHFINIKITI
jgi:hypothetical protein